MTPGGAWYVKGRKHAFPHGERLVCGPLPDSAAAHDEMRRLRPLYGDAALSVVLERGASLPERTPRGSFGLDHKEGRRAAAEAVRVRCAALGVDAVVEEWDGDPDVDFALPFLRANIWLAHHRAAPMPIISWVGLLGAVLVPSLPGAWGGERLPHYKATSEPATWSAFFEALEIGICAGLDGSAYYGSPRI